MQKELQYIEAILKERYQKGDDKFTLFFVADYSCGTWQLKVAYGVDGTCASVMFIATGSTFADVFEELSRRVISNEVVPREDIIG